MRFILEQLNIFFSFIVDKLFSFFSPRSTQAPTPERVLVPVGNETLRIDSKKFLNLPGDMLTTILLYLDESEHAAVFQVNKAFRARYQELVTAAPRAYPMQTYIGKLSTPEAKLAFNEDVTRIKQSHPKHFIKTLGGMGKIFQIPVMDIGQQMGDTGYLDFAVHMTAPVVRGFDTCGRAFYFAEATVGTHTSTFKVFQRYTGSMAWECAGSAGAPAIAENILDAMGERNNRNSMAEGVDRERLGLRGLNFFARLVSQGTVGRPVEYGYEDSHGPWVATRESSPDDLGYSPITLINA